MSERSGSLHENLLFWALLPALFILVAELQIGNLRWWAYVLPLVVALVGALLVRDVVGSERNPLGREDVFKIISMSGAAIVAIALTGTFFESTRREQEKLYQQALLEQCTNASKVLAKFASVPPWQVDQDSYRTFWQLFFGPLILVEGREVSEAMVKLGILINDDVAPLSYPIGI
jgi:hypothetical protein